MRLPYSSVALIFLSLAANPAWAQSPAQLIRSMQSGDGDFVEFGEAMMMMQEGMPSGENGEAPKGPPSPRLQALQKLEFDRRPSTILATWSTPPKKPEEAKPADAKPGDTKPGDAKPADAKPGDAKPAEVQPADAKPADKPADPTAAKPVETPPPADETPEQAAARVAAKATAEAAAAKAKEEAAKKAAEAKAIVDEMAALQRNVTLGDWKAVKEYLATLTEAEWKGGYERMLQSLVNGPQQRPQVPQQGQQYIEKNRLSPDDVTGLARAAPKKLEKSSVTLLGQMLRQSLDAGHQLERFLGAVTPQLDDPTFGVDRRLLARILVAANEPRFLASLIPTAAEATEKNDREGLNLISRYALAQYAKDSKLTWLEEAWNATQAVLAVGEVDEETKKEALTRAVEVA
ncbi:MAG TPA: hypothetical protein VM509_05880, partial [Planctomycetota bacterium]|nr:hypothetical protein [Planctomycetota bacterium]